MKEFMINQIHNEIGAMFLELKKDYIENKNYINDRIKHYNDKIIETQNKLKVQSNTQCLLNKIEHIKEVIASLRKVINNEPIDEIDMFIMPLYGILYGQQWREFNMWDIVLSYKDTTLAKVKQQIYDYPAKSLRYYMENDLYDCFITYKSMVYYGEKFKKDILKEYKEITKNVTKNDYFVTEAGIINGNI